VRYRRTVCRLFSILQEHALGRRRTCANKFTQFAQGKLLCRGTKTPRQELADGLCALMVPVESAAGAAKTPRWSAAGRSRVFAGRAPAPQGADRMRHAALHPPRFLGKRGSSQQTSGRIRAARTMELACHERAKDTGLHWAVSNRSGHNSPLTRSHVCACPAAAACSRTKTLSLRN
jgi:hypothetical protein